MAYQRELNTVVPVLAAEHTEVDDAVLVWLTCESFHRVAESEHLVITEWADLGDMDPSEVSPQTEHEVLQRPATDFRWRRFRGVATRAPYASVG